MDEINSGDVLKTPQINSFKHENVFAISFKEETQKVKLDLNKNFCFLFLSHSLSLSLFKSNRR